MVIAITGGIGSGKSVVARMVATFGYNVYDCDKEAKRLMDSDCAIHRDLCNFIHPSAVTDQGIDRTLISDVVFKNRTKLERLNRIVHGAVREDFKRWCKLNNGKVLFVETAILFESGFDKLVDSIWHVTSNTETRIERVIKRSGLSREQIIARINSQSHIPTYNSLPILEIYNDLNTPLLPQIETAIRHIEG